jgi:hypothetical protein
MRHVIVAHLNNDIADHHVARTTLQETPKNTLRRHSCRSGKPSLPLRNNNLNARLRCCEALPAFAVMMSKKSVIQDYL